jgi:hypothetical protein
MSGNDEHALDPGQVIKRVKGTLLNVGDVATLSKLARRTRQKRLMSSSCPLARRDTVTPAPVQPAPVQPAPVQALPGGRAPASHEPCSLQAAHAATERGPAPPLARCP